MASRWESWYSWREGKPCPEGWNGRLYAGGLWLQIVFLSPLPSTPKNRTRTHSREAAVISNWLSYKGRGPGTYSLDFNISIFRFSNWLGVREQLRTLFARKVNYYLLAILKDNMSPSRDTMANLHPILEREYLKDEVRIPIYHNPETKYLYVYI